MSKIEKKGKNKPTEEEIFDAFCDKVRDALNGEKSVIADAQNLRYDHRKKLKDIAEEKHKSVCAVIFDLKKSELEERNAQSAHPIPQQELDEMYAKFSNECAKVRNEFQHVYTVNAEGKIKDEETEGYY